MSGVRLAGLDIGTTSIGGLVVDEAGAVIASTVRANAAWITSDQPWERIQDPQAILAATAVILADLSASCPGIRGVGLTGQMHGIVYLDHSGQPVSPLYTWQDQRGALPAKEGTLAENLSARTNHALATGYGLVTHRYNLDHGLVPAGAAVLCSIADYVAMKLAGQTAPVMDPTQAAGLGLFDAAAGRFDAAALTAAGIETDILPTIAASGSVVGRTPDGVPVAASLGDNQASFLGSVRDPDAALLVNVGTGGQISAFCPGYAAAAGLETRPFPGGCLLVGATLCAGRAYALLEGFFRDVCRTFTGGGPESVYDIMAQLFARPLAGEALRVDTRFLGTRARPDGRGAIAGIGLDNFTPQHLVAGFLEGIAGELHDLFDLLPPAVSGGKTQLVGAGNGLRRNAALRGVCARRFGLPLRLPVHQEEAAYGAALSAGVGAGVYRDFREAAGVIRYRTD
ncbi:MAG: FGGY family carbohydrate kinase [Pseudomonadota bacterium]|nr:FGGY family carbohydrate kinase [Pseudomonadota bacterium]